MDPDAEARERALRALPPADRAFLDRALERGLLTAAAAAAAAEEWRSSASDGRPLLLAQILVRRRLLTVSQFQAIWEAVRPGSPGPPVEPAAPARSSEPPTSGRIGRFEIREELGRGGMGVVYRAWDPQVGREVALKVLLPEREESEAARERFRREALAAARLDHPNIVKVHEAGSLGDRDYFVMPLVRGRSLDAHARERPLPVPQALGIVRDVARALQVAHEAGIVHRDIKPQNIIIDESGAPRLTDFGLAKLQGARALTRTHAIVGTPFYMSPEQADGEFRGLDARSDLFSLGVVLFELLTGCRPFDAPSPAALLLAILEEPAPAASRVKPGLPPAVDAVVARALEKDPADRYPTLGAFAEDIDRVLVGQAPATPGSSSVRRAARRLLGRGRRSRVPVVGGLLGLGLAASVVLGIAFGVRLGEDAGGGRESPARAALRRALPPIEQASRLDAAGDPRGARGALDAGLAALEEARSLDGAGDGDVSAEIAHLRAIALGCRGLILLDEGDRTGAEACAAQAESGDPSVALPPEAVVLRAKLCLLSNRPDDARSLLDGLAPAEVPLDVAVRAAEAAQEAGSARQAIACAERVVSREEEVPASLAVRGAAVLARALVEEGDFARAVITASNGLLRGESAELRRLRARAAMLGFAGAVDGGGELAGAAADAAVAAEAAGAGTPARQAAVELLGEIYLRAGLAEEAIRVFDGFRAEVGGMGPDAGLAYAVALSRVGRLDDAEAVARSLDSPAARALLAGIAADRGAAVADFPPGVPDPDGDAAPYRLAGLSEAEGFLRRGVVEWSDALFALSRSVRRAPDDGPVRLARGRFLLALGRRDEAIADAMAAVRLLPEDPTAHLLLGDVLARDAGPGSPDAAVAEASRAEALGAPPWEAARVRAVAHLAAGRGEEALAEARRAVEAGRWEVRAYETLAGVSRAVGRIEDADAAEAYVRQGGLDRDEEAYFERMEMLAGVRAPPETHPLRDAPLLREGGVRERSDEGLILRGDAHYALGEIGPALLDWGRLAARNPSAIPRLSQGFGARTGVIPERPESLVTAGPRDAGLAEIAGGLRRLAPLFHPEISLPTREEAAQACRLLTRAIDLRPDAAGALVLRALAHLVCGRLEWAEADARRAYAAGVGRETTTVVLAAVLVARGRTVEALPFLEGSPSSIRDRSIRDWPWFQGVPELRSRGDGRR